MRILVHDFGGYAFPLQLSRALAAKGHSVLHIYPVGLPGPKGCVQRRPEDPQEFRVQGVTLPGYFRKYSPVRRLLAQRRYSKELLILLNVEKPDVVLSADTPIDVQITLLRYCKKNQIGFIHWVQDVYCDALKFLLKRPLGKLAGLAAFPFYFTEKLVSRNSDAVIVIAQSFLARLLEMGTPAENVSVIQNWAPLDELRILDRMNRWRAEMRLDDRPIFLYSGTLGLKHRPDLLYRLAQRLGDRGQVVVVSEGVGREWLERLPAVNNLKLINFQPYDRVPEVLATADVLLASLESDAATFAVPSKVLSYLCAGRPILIAAPHSNLAAEVVQRSGGGMAFGPSEDEIFLSTAVELAADPRERTRLGTNARQYAERQFDIQAIAANFEAIIVRSARRSLSTETIPSPVLTN